MIPSPRGRIAGPITIVAVALLAAAPGFARETVGVYAGWGVFRDDSPARCYAMSAPVRHGGHAFASVATYPARGIRDQIAIALSRPVGGDTPVTLSIGERRFTLVARGAAAWAPDARTDAAIVAAMRSGRSMSIEGVSATGRPFVDAYALPGAASAIDAAALACLGR